MSKRDGNFLVRGARRAAGTTQRQAGKLVRGASWAREKATTVLAPRLGEQVEGLMRTLAEPENVHRIQSAFAHVAQKGMELGFRADPDAAELYKFVAWLEERHGREPVLMRIAEHAASTESGVRHALEAGLVGLAQPHGSEARRQAAQQLHDLRDSVAEDLLALLCSLAALEDDSEVPLGAEAQVEFFEAADVPAEFMGLAAKAAGLEGAFDSEVDDAEPSTSGGLTKFVPSFDDPHLRFLTLTQLFFIHSYLTRNLIERLPELIAFAQSVEAPDFE